MELEDIFTFENLLEAHKLCRLSKQHKHATIMFELEAGTAISSLAAELKAKTYRLGKYKRFKVYDPKERIIEALPYKDRVALMCFCKNSLEPRLEKRLIYDNAASRVGRGTDFAIGRLHGFMRRLHVNTRGGDIYFLKCDISKYFASIDHDILLSKLGACGFSEGEMWFMELVIRSYGSSGVPLGNQTSQWFALLYLDEIDRLVKEKLRVKSYVRYMDDFILLSEDKGLLRECKAEIARTCGQDLKLRLNAKTQIGRLKNGLDFLGFNHRLLETGKIVRVMRAAAKRRQRHYIKTISRYYLDDIVDDEYLGARQAAFRAHLKGTKQKKFVDNEMNGLRKKKRALITSSHLCRGRFEV